MSESVSRSNCSGWFIRRRRHNSHANESEFPITLETATLTTPSRGSPNQPRMKERRNADRNDGRDDQRVKRRGRVAGAAQERRVDDVGEDHRTGEEDRLCIGVGFGNDVGRRREPAEHGRRDRHADRGNRDAAVQRRAEGGSRDLLDAVMVAGTKACPIRTVLPLAIPIRNEISRNRIGKTAETAASAGVPISRPIQMLPAVCVADCSRLLSISGTRKTRAGATSACSRRRR